jgi:hypothetical protein
MKKSVFALAVTGVTFASALSSVSPAGAINYVYQGNTYDVKTYTGSFNDLQSTLTNSTNSLWGNQSLALGLAIAVGISEGTPNLIGGTIPVGPGFVYGVDENSSTQGVAYSAQLGGLYEFKVLPSSSSVFATAQPTAVPWDISGSATIFGSIAGIGLGVGLKRLKSRKNINIKE